LRFPSFLYASIFANWEVDEVNGRARLVLMGLVVRRMRDVVRILDLNIEVWEV
jgi:hypothetical protein